MGDRLGEAKASGNLGNTLKVRTHYSLKGFTTLVLLELKSAEKLIKAKSYVYVHGTIYLSISQRRFT